MGELLELGLYKDYIMPQAAEYLCLSINRIIAGKTFYEKEDVLFIKKLLENYTTSRNYTNKNLRKEAYNKFVGKSFPDTLRVVKTAINKGVLNKELWLPVIKDFFNKAIQYTNNVPGVISENF